MTLFTKATNTQAYLKMGLMGLAGSGKTYTAAQTAIGLIQYLRERELQEAGRPVYFADTETGSSYVKHHFDKAKIELFTAKTRAFSDLIALVNEAENNSGVLMIDSITHFWREFTESYARKKDKKRLEFPDWNYLKTEWGRFTDRFVNSHLHIIMCGRMGYEYDFFTDDDGKKQLEKTAVKMKAETETGYEPSILVWMERAMDMDKGTVYREAHILKERFDVIDGMTFKNPTFETFMPHIKLLNLGGEQVGVDSTRSSEGMIPGNEGRSDWQIRKEQKEIILEKVQALFVEHGLSGQSKEGKAAIIGHLKKHFGTTSWKEVEASKFELVKDGYNSLHLELNGAPAYAPQAETPVEDVPA
jgi:AAA domain-containing protein